MSVLFFLSSGIFLGWSHGANNAANVFGTAIGSKMVKFKTAAIITSIFVVLGSTVSGAGASLTLGRLGSVNEIAGSFIVALAAAVTLLWMTKFKLPVSTSQSIVGSIIGWNLFSGSITDYRSLTKIVSSWMVAPVVSAVFAVAIYMLFRYILRRARIHLLYLDFINRIGLIIVGAFGAYSLGANNIANVMGVFIPVVPFRPIETYFGTLSGSEQLFILGGMAMAAGVMTYSYKVMQTVGESIILLTPITALVVVLSSSTVLFLFSSQNLESFLSSHSLPVIPLVPISSSQAVVGAIIGIGIYQGGRGMNFRLLGKIASGWVTAPVIACTVSFISLFVIQNVFSQQVFRPVKYNMNVKVSDKLKSEGITFRVMNDYLNFIFTNAVDFRGSLKKNAPDLSRNSMDRVIELSEIYDIQVDTSLISYEISEGWFTAGQAGALRYLEGRNYRYSWELRDDLERISAEWRMKSGVADARQWNRDIEAKLDYIYKKFRTAH